MLSADRAMRRLGCTYLLVQSAALGAFWIAFASNAELRLRFVAPGAPISTFGAFGASDLLLLLPTSITAALALGRNHHASLLVLSLHAGAALYASFYAFAFAVIQPERWLGAALMAPMSIVPAMLTWWVWRGERTLRSAQARTEHSA